MDFSIKTFHKKIFFPCHFVVDWMYLKSKYVIDFYLTVRKFRRSNLTKQIWGSRQKQKGIVKAEDTHLLKRESITVRLTPCLTSLDLTKLSNLYLIQQKQSIWILTSQTGGLLYSDTSPCNVSECSLVKAEVRGRKWGNRGIILHWEKLKTRWSSSSSLSLLNHSRDKHSRQRKKIKIRNC